MFNVCKTAQQICILPGATPCAPPPPPTHTHVRRPPDALLLERVQQRPGASSTGSDGCQCGFGTWPSTCGGQKQGAMKRQKTESAAQTTLWGPVGCDCAASKGT
jgi:hypothetical protein